MLLSLDLKCLGNVEFPNFARFKEGKGKTKRVERSFCGQLLRKTKLNKCDLFYVFGCKIEEKENPHIPRKQFNCALAERKTGKIP